MNMTMLPEIVQGPIGPWRWIPYDAWVFVNKCDELDNVVDRWRTHRLPCVHTAYLIRHRLPHSTPPTSFDTAYLIRRSPEVLNWHRIRVCPEPHGLHQTTQTRDASRTAHKGSFWPMFPLSLCTRLVILYIDVGCHFGLFWRRGTKCRTVRSSASLSTPFGIQFMVPPDS